MEMLHPTFALLRADVVAEAAATSLAHGGVPTRGLAATPALMPKDAPLIQTLFGLSRSGGLENAPRNHLLLRGEGRAGWGRGWRSREGAVPARLCCFPGRSITLFV